jgi:hypothetical protein
MTKAANLASLGSVVTVPIGSAPSYQCRAWVNFNGQGTVGINASGNVSSITDNGTGDYTVNFTTAMQDNLYSWSFASQYVHTGSIVNQNIWPMMMDGLNLVSPSSLRFRNAVYSGATNYDCAIVAVSIFR